jgi:hypothetical protein
MVVNCNSSCTVIFIVHKETWCSYQCVFALCVSSASLFQGLFLEYVVLSASLSSTVHIYKNLTILIYNDNCFHLGM